MSTLHQNCHAVQVKFWTGGITVVKSLWFWLEILGWFQEFSASELGFSRRTFLNLSCRWRQLMMSVQLRWCRVDVENLLQQKWLNNYCPRWIFMRFCEYSVFFYKFLHLSVTLLIIAAEVLEHAQSFHGWTMQKKHFNKTLVSVVRFCLLVFIRSFLCCDKAAKITTQTYFVSTVMFC